MVSGQRCQPRDAASSDSQDFRDLQVLSQLVWFDEEFLEHDPEVARLVDKGRDYTLRRPAADGTKSNGRFYAASDAGLSRICAARGQIEISTTPYYHPILPLLCDSNIAGVSHPDVPLPPPLPLS